MKEMQVEQWKDLKNMEKSKLNSEKIWKIGKKRGKRYKKYEVNGEKIVKLQKKGKINSEKTWKTWKNVS